MAAYDHLFKVLLIGDAGVGKSSILLRFTDDTFNEHLEATIGVDFKVKMIDVGGKKCKVTVWDTAGQERFRTLTSSYYRGAQGVVLCYDVTRRDTFDNLEPWLQEVELYCPASGKDVVKLLVGNKKDKAESSGREVEGREAMDWARTKGMMFIECSAKTKEGIESVFREVVHKILERPSLLRDTEPGSASGSASLDGGEPSEGGGCC